NNFMKETRSLVKSLIVCGATLAMVTSLVAQTTGGAKVVRIKGHARYSTGNNVFPPLKVGAVLKPGTIIQTAQDGYVDLVLGDGEGGMVGGGPAGSVGPNAPLSSDPRSYTPTADQNIVRIHPNSILQIDKLNMMQTGAEPVSEVELD